MLEKDYFPLKSRLVQKICVWWYSHSPQKPNPDFDFFNLWKPLVINQPISLSKVTFIWLETFLNSTAIEIRIKHFLLKLDLINASARLHILNPPQGNSP